MFDMSNFNVISFLDALNLCREALEDGHDDVELNVVDGDGS